MPDTTHHKIAQLMARVTRNVLWKPWQHSAGQAGTNELHCRAGRGRATYHRFHPQSRRHEIVFGALMVADKHDPTLGENWLSTREIRQRGYWGGEVSTLNLLAHTCCHEFAHLQQYSTGQRSHGRVHTPGFYRLLDGLHQCGAAEDVRRQLVAGSRELTLPVCGRPWPEPRTDSLQSRFQPGDEIRFGQGAHAKTGRVLKVNRRTCTVEGTGRIAGRRYRVPGPLMEKISSP